MAMCLQSLRSLVGCDQAQMHQDYMNGEYEVLSDRFFYRATASVKLLSQLLSAQYLEVVRRSDGGTVNTMVLMTGKDPVKLTVAVHEWISTKVWQVPQ
jgi:hypothetical protein